MLEVPKKEKKGLSSTQANERNDVTQGDFQEYL